MANHLSIDPALIGRALDRHGARSREAAVALAVEPFIVRRRQRGAVPSRPTACRAKSAR